MIGEEDLIMIKMKTVIKRPSTYIAVLNLCIYSLVRQSYREGKRESEVIHLLVHSSNGCNRLGQYKGRSQEIWLSQMGARDPSAWAIICCLPVM